MITIGQLARYVGVSTKTIRVYHAKGLLPEPGRDASGYRRYSAQDAIELIKIRVLAEAGVPLGKILKLRDAPDDEFRRTLDKIDDDLTARIRSLRQTRGRLRELAGGHARLLPGDVNDHLQQLSDIGFSHRWVEMESDLWILAFATHPDVAGELFRDQAQALTDPNLRQIYLDYDHAHDLDPLDPSVAQLAKRIVDATRARYGRGDLPGQATSSNMAQLMQSAVNASSPAWHRLDSLIRDRSEPLRSPHQVGTVGRGGLLPCR